MILPVRVLAARNKEGEHGQGTYSAASVACHFNHKGGSEISLSSGRSDPGSIPGLGLGLQRPTVF